MNGNLIDLKGIRFGQLLVIDRVVRLPTHGTAAKWKCLCDCGNESIVESSKLRKGKTKSCGCWRRDKMIAKFRRRKYDVADYSDTWEELREWQRDQK